MLRRANSRFHQHELAHAAADAAIVVGLARRRLVRADGALGAERRLGFSLSVEFAGAEDDAVGRSGSLAVNGMLDAKAPGIAADARARAVSCGDGESVLTLQTGVRICTSPKADARR